jgi:hypothetical protein
MLEPFLCWRLLVVLSQPLQCFAFSWKEGMLTESSIVIFNRGCTNLQRATEDLGNAVPENTKFAISTEVLAHYRELFEQLLHVFEKGFYALEFFVNCDECSKGQCKSLHTYGGRGDDWDRLYRILMSE